jgi:photosystem II stability/assembly factor-like uncharacterized protein
MPFKNRILPDILTAALLFTVFATYSQDGWIDQQKPINVALNACCFPVDNGSFYGQNYWIAGDSGYILKSSSYQNAWSRLESCTTENLNGIYFFHDGTGFCVGDNGTLIKTETFGNQWEIIPLDLNNNLNDILFITDTTALIAGDSGLLLKSTDKGLTWVNIELNTSYNLNKIRKLTDSLIWIVGDHGTVLKTTYGGNTWVNINAGIQDNINDFFMPDSECIVLVGDDGLVLQSDNGGASWLNLDFPISSDLNGITGGETCNTFYVCGNEGTIYYWSIYDTAWHAYQGETGGLNFHSIIFQPDNYYNLFLADSGSYIMVSGYSGYSDLQKVEENLYFQDIDFIDLLNGYIAGNVATLLHTTDGGENWYSLHLGDFPGNNRGLDAYDVEFTDPLHGFVLLERYLYNENSIILGTQDGGLTWTNLYYSTSQRLTCMYFLDSLHGWVGADRGYIMRTNDGGLTWIIVQPHNSNFNDVVKIYFYNLQDGYFIRDYGDFYVTHDGGATCELTMAFGSGADDFSVVSDSLIWVVKNGVYHSTDWGYLWSYQTVPNDFHYPKSVYFIDQLEGWLAGSDRSLWHTIDGGEYWFMEYSETNGDDFSQLTFTSIANGWAIGHDSFIMHGPGLYTGYVDKQPVFENSISIFPNPANLLINVNFNNNIEIQKDDLVFTVFTMTGQQVRTMKVRGDPGNIQLDISDLQPGIYFAALKLNNSIISSGKFIVAR